MRALFLALIPTLLAAQAIPDRPEKTPAPPLTFEAPRAADARVTLANGVTAFLVPDPTAQPLVTLQVLIRGGSYLDPKGKAGLTSAWGTLLRQGGTQGLTPEQLDARLDFLAAQANVRVEADQVELTLNLMEKDLREGLALVRDMLATPAFAPERLDLWRRNQLRSLEQLNDDPRTIERYQLLMLTHGSDHPAATWPTAEALKGLTREDLVAHHARMLHPGNLLVSVGGRFDRTALLPLLNETLGRLKAGPEARRNPPPPPPAASWKPGLYVVHKENPQGRVSFLLPGLRRDDPDWVAVDVMNFILGGDFTSRLTYLIRTQEGLSYTVGSGYEPGAWHPGTFRALFQTKAASVAYGCRLMLGELKRIQEQPVTEAELAKAKGALINGFPAAFASAEEVAQLHASEAFHGHAEGFHRTYREKVKALTPADIQRVARRYLPLDRLAVLVVGPREAMEAGDPKDRPGRLSETLGLPVVSLPLWEPMTRQPQK